MLLALFLMLLQPDIRIDQSDRIQRTAVLLIDASASMQVPEIMESASGGEDRAPHRLDTARRILSGDPAASPQGIC